MNKLFFNILGFCLSLVIAIRTVIFFIEPADTLLNVIAVILFFLSIAGLYYWAKYILIDCVEEDMEDPEEN